MVKFYEKKISMKNIFFINSPFQLLCAIEAKAFFNLNNSILIIFNKGKGRNYDQISNLLSNYQSSFDEVIELEYKLKSLTGWLNGFKKFERLIKCFPKVGTIFIGDYRNGLVRHFHNSVSYENIYIIDDGFATINVYKKIKNTFNYDYKEKIKLILSFFRYRYKINENITFFTMFAPLFSKENVINNEFINIFHNISKKTSENIYFLGTPLVEDKIVSKEYYLKKIKEITDHFGSVSVTYFPHRREERKKLREIELKTEIKVQEISIPIELYLMDAEWPSKVISFYSTALYSISKMFSKIEVYAINIESTEINSSKEEIDAIYRILKSEVKVI